MDQLQKQTADTVSAIQDKIAVVDAQDALNEARYTQVKNSLAKQKTDLIAQVESITATAKPQVA